MASLALGNPGATFPRGVDVAVDQVVETRTDRPTRRSRRRGFRKDIEGLRAVAILAVVLYHAHVGAVPGGYVGVDVFFVISGYLITDHLWREVRERRALSFSGFYGRRIRRLLPASFLVLAVTAIASAVILPPLTARSVLKDGLACALYVGNYRFAFVSTNYLTASAPPSPFQQYWSLGVEEQFYLIWPAVLLCASMAWRRRPSRTSAVAVLGVIAVSSCAFSVWLTNANQPWAFFSLPTRAWELAVGGLVALCAPELGRLRGRPLVGWIGLGLVAWAVFTYTSTTAFPGTAALVPVLGAAAIIAAGCGDRPAHGPVQILRTSPMQVVGRVSYSWYLWHWPFLILVPDALGHPLSLAQNLGVAGLSFLVAVATFVVIERPVRLSTWLTARPRRSLGLGVALSLGAVGACVLSVVSLPSLTGTGHAPVAAAALRASTKEGGGGPRRPAADQPGAGPAVRGDRGHQPAGGPHASRQRRTGQPRAHPPGRQCRRASGVRERMPGQLHRHLAAALHFGRHRTRRPPWCSSGTRMRRCGTRRSTRRRSNSAGG